MRTILLVLAGLLAAAPAPRRTGAGEPPIQTAQQSTPIPADLGGLRPGPVAARTAGDALTVEWQDETARPWSAVFSLRPGEPLISAISVAGKAVVERARPLYWCETGKRRGGFDEFFDFPPSHPEGTRSAKAICVPLRARAETRVATASRSPLTVSRWDLQRLRSVTSSIPAAG